MTLTLNNILLRNLDYLNILWGQLDDLNVLKFYMEKHL